MTRRERHVLARVSAQRPSSTFPGEMEVVNLPRSRYLQVSNEDSAVKGGFATERSEAPLTAGGSEVARLALGAGDAPLPSFFTIFGAKPQRKAAPNGCAHRLSFLQ